MPIRGVPKKGSLVKVGKVSDYFPKKGQIYRTKVKKVLPANTAPKRLKA